MPRDGWLAALVIGVLASAGGSLLSNKVLTRPSRPRTLPGSGEVPTQRTGLRPDAWAIERYDVAMQVLDNLGIPDDIRNQVARALVAQWAHETRRGASEYNYNVGGMIRRPGRPWFRTRGAREADGSRQYEWSAFLSPDDGVRQHVDLLRRRHARAWEMLLAAPEHPGWVRQLRESGYYTAPASAYADAWEAQRAWVDDVLR